MKRLLITLFAGVVLVVLANLVSVRLSKSIYRELDQQGRKSYPEKITTVFDLSGAGKWYRAANDCQVYIQAITAYTIDNQKYPLRLEEDVLLTGENFASLLDVLSGRDASLNERNYEYLETAPHTDPWGNSYFAKIDGNFDGTLEFGGKPFNVGVVIWSAGPNGLNEEGRGDDPVAY